jgi:TonB family protein
MKRWLGALSCLVSASVAHAQDDARILTPAQMQARAAHIVLFVPPEFPASATGEATVDVTGEVGTDGTFTVRNVVSSSEDPAFASAVREVTRFWLLRPDYESDCTPRTSTGQVRVWFERKDGKPVISVSQPRSESTDTRPLKIVRRRAPDYPQSMLVRGMTGAVEALLRISPGGRVEELELVPGPITRLAAREVSTALRQWRFEPRPEAEGSICASYVVEFGISSGFAPRSGADGRRRDGAN